MDTSLSDAVDFVSLESDIVSSLNEISRFCCVSNLSVARFKENYCNLTMRYHLYKKLGLNTEAKLGVIGKVFRYRSRQKHLI